MKLFTRYTRINLVSTVVIFLLSSVAFYFLLRFVLIDQVDDSLVTEQHEIETYAQEHNKLFEVIPVKDQETSYKETDTEPKKRSFKTISAYNKHEKEKYYIREIVFPLKVNDQWYEVTVSRSLEETDDVIRSVILITLATIILILVSTLLINRLVLRRLWKPFYKTLDVIRGFQLGQEQPGAFPSTNIDEFNQMNNTLQQATGKAQQDYRILKEFTENASHELQTPLAIIRSKLDILIQDDELSETQSQAVQSANNALQRLSRMNQSLLLLAKIENNQFAETSGINLKQKIEEKLLQFQELWESRQVIVSATLEEVRLQMNAELADILLNNLLGNALRYTPAQSNIDITLNKQQCTVSNTAAGEPLQGEHLFSRFHKSVSSGEGNGLGLSIIKQICDASGYTITYTFSNHMHHFTIRF